MPTLTVQPSTARPETDRDRRHPRGTTPAVARLDALDVFRGLTMAAMVIVNNPGTWSAVYWPLDHADWNGWTPTDLIFPFFLFIVGVSLTISRQTLEGPVSRLLRRAAVLVALGLLLTGFPRFDLNHWRFTGILPRIAFCYVLAALAYRWSPADPRRKSIAIATLAAVIAVAYWQVLIHFGDLTPEGNAGAALDRALFGSHLYRSGRWDPEGLLSSVPAVSTTLIGVLAGMWLRSAAPTSARIARLAGAGGVLFVAGELWHPWFPINKNLWTSSYVLMTGGAAAIALAVCIFLIDIREWRERAHPLVVLGRNAIALFVVSGLIGKAFIVWDLQRPIYQYGFGWIPWPKVASLTYAVMFLLMMYTMCHWMYRRRIFLKA